MEVGPDPIAGARLWKCVRIQFPELDYEVCPDQISGARLWKCDRIRLSRSGCRYLPVVGLCYDLPLPPENDRNLLVVYYVFGGDISFFLKFINYG